MPVSLKELVDLPSPFYRVALKAIVLDAQQRLLVVINHDGEAEMPGGGWEHDETLEQGLQRELEEEVGVQAASISPVQFTFQSTSDHGWRVVRIFVRAQLLPGVVRAEDDTSGVRWVTKDEFLALQFDLTDAPIQQYVNEIWT